MWSGYCIRVLFVGCNKDGSDVRCGNALAPIHCHLHCVPSGHPRNVYPGCMRAQARISLLLSV
jgi:hypothetical protein